MKKHFWLTIIGLCLFNWLTVSAQANPAPLTDECGIVFSIKEESLTGWKYPPGLYGMKTDGSDVHPLIKADVMMEDSKIVSFSPSPDGHRFAVHVYRENADRKPGKDFIESNAIFIVDLADLSTSILADNAQSPAWSPDGEKLAYLSGYSNDDNIYIYNFATDLTTVIDGKIESYEGIWVNTIGDWSPDSQKLALIVWVAEPDLDQSNYIVPTLLILDLEKQELTRLLPKFRLVNNVTWESSNHVIYYDDFNYENSFWGIWKLDLQSLAIEEVLNFGTSLEELQEENFGWGTQLDINNEGRIIFIGLPKYQDIYLFDQKTQVVTNLTQTDNVREENPVVVFPLSCRRRLIGQRRLGLLQAISAMQRGRADLSYLSGF